MNGIPEGIDTASMATKLIDDIQVIDPGSIPVEILDLRLSSRIFPKAPSKETVMYIRLHSHGLREASERLLTW